MRADYIPEDSMKHLLAALMPENRLALQASMASGLRIGDVLRLRTARLAKRMTVREEKTQKSRRVYWPNDLYFRLLKNAGKFYVFPGRLSERKHRTRQAVYKDLTRTAKLFRLDGRRLNEHVSPHTARKIYAVEQLRRYGGNVRKVQQLLNHSNEAVTCLYALADQLTERRLHGRVTGRPEK